MANPSVENLQDVRSRVSDATRRAGRNSADINLIAVSKTHGADDIEPVLAAGQRDFGENRVQEAQTKWPALKERYADAVLHLIGSLQSNKAEAAVALFDVIHVLDRPSLADALSRAMIKLNRQVPCFVQVNIGAEEQKGGCAIADVPALLAHARSMSVPVIGLMCLPPADKTPEPYFALLQKLAADQDLSRLSMGMSGDYEAALQLGATDIRVGSAIFGKR
jgi:PLP dependent protein